MVNIRALEISYVVFESNAPSLGSRLCAVCRYNWVRQWPCPLAQNSARFDLATPRRAGRRAAEKNAYFRPLKSPKRA